MKKSIRILFCLVAVLATVLCVFTACNKDEGVVKYNLSFQVDGEDYYSVSTAGNETITLPAEPQKLDYVFDGWYLDKNVWKTPFTADMFNSKALDGDKTVYAKWSIGCKHVFSEEWAKSSKFHWHEATCGHEVTTEAEAHSFNAQNVCVCGFEKPLLSGTELSAKTLEQDGNYLYISLSNDTDRFSFLNEISVADDATYSVHTDIGCTDATKLNSKTAGLQIGDNNLYILVENDSEINLYTVTIRRRPIYTVTFDVKGGEAVETQYVEENSFATLPETSRKGYTFTEWDYDFEDAIVEDTKVTAGWEVNTYTITYDYAIEESSASQEVENTNPATYTVEDAITFVAPTRSGYAFKGWDVAEIAKGSVDAVTVTASWEVVPYTITYDLAVAADSKSQNVENDANPTTYTVEDEVAFVAPVRTGYTFQNWSKANLEKGTTGNQTITANWKVTEYTITYILNGGENADENIASFNIEMDEASFAIADATHESNLFCGWYENDVEGEYITEIQKSTLRNYTLYAAFGAFELETNEETELLTITEYFGKEANVVLPRCYKGEAIEAIAEYAFAACEELESIALPSGLKRIESSAFDGCSALKSIVLPDSVTYLGLMVFGSCSELAEVVLSANLTVIEPATFKYCANLESITLPAGLTSIGEDAFAECSKLAEVVFEGTQEQWDAVVKEDGWNAGTADGFKVTCNG